MATTDAYQLLAASKAKGGIQSKIPTEIEEAARRANESLQLATKMRSDLERLFKTPTLKSIAKDIRRQHKRGDKLSEHESSLVPFEQQLDRWKHQISTLEKCLNLPVAITIAGDQNSGKSWIGNEMVGKRIFISQVGHATGATTTVSTEVLSHMKFPAEYRSLTSGEWLEFTEPNVLRPLIHADCGKPVPVQVRLCRRLPTAPVIRIIDHEDVVLRDSPGLNVDDLLSKEIVTEHAPVECVLLVVDGTASVSASARAFVEDLHNLNPAVDIFVVFNKMDMVPEEEVNAQIQRLILELEPLHLKPSRFKFTSMRCVRESEEKNDLLRWHATDSERYAWYVRNFKEMTEELNHLLHQNKKLLKYDPIQDTVRESVLRPVREMAVNIYEITKNTYMRLRQESEHLQAAVDGADWRIQDTAASTSTMDSETVQAQAAAFAHSTCQDMQLKSWIAENVDRWMKIAFVSTDTKLPGNLTEATSQQFADMLLREVLKQLEASLKTDLAPRIQGKAAAFLRALCSKYAVPAVATPSVDWRGVVGDACDSIRAGFKFRIDFHWSAIVSGVTSAGGVACAAVAVTGGLATPLVPFIIAGGALGGLISWGCRTAYRKLTHNPKARICNLLADMLIGKFNSHLITAIENGLAAGIVSTLYQCFGQLDEVANETKMQAQLKLDDASLSIGVLGPIVQEALRISKIDIERFDSQVVGSSR